MKIESASAIVTGAASGLGLATTRRLLDRGAHVTLVDLPTSDGAAIAASLGDRAGFVSADVTDPDAVDSAIAAATSVAPLRVLVHCAGRGGMSRVVERDGRPGDHTVFSDIVRVNLVGSYTVLSRAAAAMVGNEPEDSERGVCIMTASIAAWEGQIGQTAYASSKAGIVGMTLVAARDLASRQVRVCTIAPGVFDTPILARLDQELKNRLAASIPHPSRLGDPEEFARLAESIIEIPMLNGETIRLDGAIRMAAR